MEKDKILKRYSHRDDFKLIVRFPEDGPLPSRFPDYDITLTFYIDDFRQSNRYTASVIGGVCTSCHETDRGEMMVIFNRHNLGVGRLMCDVRAKLPDSLSDDGKQDVTFSFDTCVELVEGVGDLPTPAEVEAMLPFIKGKDALEYALEAGYEGDAEQFARDLAAVGNKVDKVEGKGLSANDYTDADKKKVEALPEHVQPLVAFDAGDFSHDAATGTLSLTDAARRSVFIDLWKAAGKKYTGHPLPAQLTNYNPDNGLFTYDDLTFTYEEALTIYLRSWHIAVDPAFIGYCEGDQGQFLTAVLPIPVGILRNMQGIFQNNGSVRLVAFRNNITIAENLKLAFWGCWSLIKIIGTLNVNSCSSLDRSFHGCHSLKEVCIVRLRHNISFQDSPQLSLASLQYLISNAANTAAITVTVHKDVYARIIDEGSGDWHALLEAASAKNISFATI